MTKAMNSSTSSPFPRALPGAAREALSASAQAEEIAAEINSNKRQLIDLDRRRHQTMEALAHFRQKGGKPSSIQSSSTDGKTWTCMGPFFLQLPSSQVHDMLNKDRVHLDEEITATRATIKRLLLSLQRFSPSDLHPSLVEFALREGQRVAEGKEMELEPDDPYHSD